MAKYVPIEMVKSYSGKICEHSDVYFAKKVRQASAAVKALTEEQKSAYATAFKNQKKYGSLRGYMFAQEYEKLA